MMYSSDEFAATLMANFVSHYPLANWAQEGGDPCLPASWTWVNCSSDSQPKIISMYKRQTFIYFLLYVGYSLGINGYNMFYSSLSEMNITGNIPTELTKLSGLVEM